MKARTVILTAGATIALAVPVSQAAARNALQCSASVKAKAADSYYNRRALLLGSSCASSHAQVKRARVSTAHLGLAASVLGTDSVQGAGRQSAKQQHHTRISTPLFSGPLAPVTPAVSIDPNAVSQSAPTGSVQTTPDLQGDLGNPDGSYGF
jgi:hypothetical protein